MCSYACRPTSSSRSAHCSTTVVWPHSQAAEFASGPELALEAVKVLRAAGGTAALASVINAFISRHSDKRVIIERGEARRSRRLATRRGLLSGWWTSEPESRPNVKRLGSIM